MINMILIAQIAISEIKICEIRKISVNQRFRQPLAGRTSVFEIDNTRIGLSTNQEQVNAY